MIRSLLLLLLLVELGHVQRLVNVLRRKELGRVWQPEETYPRDGFDLSPKFLLDSVERKPVVVGDQVDRHTEMAEPEMCLKTPILGYNSILTNLPLRPIL